MPIYLHSTPAVCAPDFANMLRGLSVSACSGMPRKHLNEVAQTAGRFLAYELGNLEGLTAGQELRSAV